MAEGSPRRGDLPRSLPGFHLRSPLPGGPMPREPMPDVVVLLPGILGSVLRKDGRTVWGFSPGQMGRALLTRGGRMRKDLWIEEEDHTADDLGDGITADALMPDLHLLPGLWKIDGYSAVRKGIERHFDVTEGENFFSFPYDWRRDNRVSARKLARDSHGWLARWREKGNADAQLILIGHSMGGLVSRYFLEVLEGWRDTRALLTFGTPYRGSLNALDTLSNGMTMGPRGLIDLSALTSRFMSLHQLLPTFKAYDAGDGELVRVGETEGIPGVDAAKARSALMDFHREIRSAVATNSQNPDYQARGPWIHPVVGTGQQTSQSARWTGSGVEVLRSHGGRDLSGDGTVPRVSAIPEEFEGGGGVMYSGTRHAAIQNAEAVIHHMTGIIEDLYFSLGDFMQPTTPPGRISLEVDDLVWGDEPIRVRARSEIDGGDPTATLFSGDSGTPLARSTLVADADSWRLGNFDPPGPGSYSIRVEGPAGVEPVADAVAVADLTPDEAEAEADGADDAFGG
ncbi:MAG: hypothetical protein EA350_14840 [Gemmatimonadales bacterium]|nr:MAG: hypothetical protein EA350_14840 [Gemmatimonadales bacterium]